MTSFAGQPSLGACSDAALPVAAPFGLSPESILQQAPQSQFLGLVVDKPLSGCLLIASNLSATPGGKALLQHWTLRVSRKEFIPVWCPWAGGLRFRVMSGSRYTA